GGRGRLGGNRVRCSIRKPPISTMSAGRTQDRSRRRCFSIASQPRRKSGRISTSSPGPRAPNRVVPTAPSARSRARFMPSLRSATDNSSEGALAVNFDPRIAPARPDLAAKHLEGKVTAARFVAGEEREVIDVQAPVRAGPAPDAPLVTEALTGERATIDEFNEEGGAWGQLANDGYVGWLPANALLPPRAAPTHQVTAPRPLAVPRASIKLPPAAMPPLGA